MANSSGAAFSTNDVHSGAFIVYINGIEVPCKSVSQRYGVWQIPEMQLEMVADPILTRMGAEDRIQVAVFYLDDVKVDPSIGPQFRMFGEGEITGWGYQNTPSGRSITFTCVNQMAILTQLFVHFMTNLDDMVGHYTDKLQANVLSVASSQLVYPYSLFAEGLFPLPPTDGSPPQAVQIKRPFDFLFNVVKGMIGTMVPAKQQTVPASNFFSRWARLTNFHNRFVALPFFDEDLSNDNIFPVLKALQDTSAVDLLSKNLIPQVQNTGSFWDMLQLVYQTVFMEIAMLPAMPLVTVDLKSSLIETTNFVDYLLVPDGDGKFTAAKQPNPLKPLRLANYFAKPQFLFGLPPSCNVIFPSQLKMLSYEENFATQPTRLYFNDETVNKLLKIEHVMGSVVVNVLTTAYPPEADAANVEHVLHPTFNGKNFLLFPEEFFKGPVMDRRQIPPWLFFMRQSELVNQSKNAGAAILKRIVTAGDGTVPNAVAPARTGAKTTVSRPPAPTGVMTTSVSVGKVADNGQRVFTVAVEALRPRAHRASARTGIPEDFLLAWVQAESGGDLYSLTNLNERGYFQIMGPHAAVGGNPAETLEQSEAHHIGLTESDTGSGYPLKVGERVPKLSRTGEEDFSFDAGVRLVQFYHARALAQLASVHADWPEGDVWRLTKLYHAVPAFADAFVLNSRDVFGTPAASWAEAYAKLIPSSIPGFQKWVDQATGIGSVVPTASGQVQLKDGTIVVAPQATAAPVTAADTAAPPAIARDAPQASVSNPGQPTTATEASLAAQATADQDDVYKLYAKYEFFRERYAKRSGSAIVTANPYIVPGFPAAIFDQRATRVDLCCYVTTVQHRLTHRADGKSTTISFVYGRTFQEMFDLMSEEIAAGAQAAMSTGPQEPIRDIRKVIQNFDQAEAFYQRLFYGGRSLFNKDAAFDWRKIIGYQTNEADAPPERIFIDGPGEASQDTFAAAQATYNDLKAQRDPLAQQLLQAQIQQTDAGTLLRSQSIQRSVTLGDSKVVFDSAAKALSDATAIIGVLTVQLSLLDDKLGKALAIMQTEVTTNSQTQITHNLTGDRDLVPLPTAEGMFSNFDAAMRYNWRPICTLDEYVLFHDSVGEGLVPAANHPRAVGAAYYDRIRRLTPLSSTTPFTSAATGLNVPAVTVTPANTGSPNVIVVAEPDPQTPSVVSTVPGIKSGTGPHGTNGPGDFAQTRADWDTLLTRYRQNVYNVKAPRT